MPSGKVFHIGTATTTHIIPMPARIAMVMVAWITSVSFFISFPTILQILQQLPTNSCRTLSPNISDNHPRRSRHLSRWANCHRLIRCTLDSSFVGLHCPLRRFLLGLPIGTLAPRVENWWSLYPGEPFFVASFALKSVYNFRFHFSLLF